MHVDRIGDHVQVTLDAVEAGTLAATLDFLASPLSPYKRARGVRELQPLATALTAAYDTTPEENH